MVHGLRTIERLNDKAVEKKADGRTNNALKPPAGLGPGAFRRFHNRPWPPETKVSFTGEDLNQKKKEKDRQL